LIWLAVQQRYKFLGFLCVSIASIQGITERPLPCNYNIVEFFHGGNTGSNPLGDGNNRNELSESGFIAEGLKGFDKKKPLRGRLLCPRPLAQHEKHFDKLCLRRALRRSDGLCAGIGVIL